MKHLRRHAVALGAVLALTVSGCGSGDGGGSSGPGGERPAGPDGTPIKIGLAVAQTGFASGVIKPVTGVAQAWTDWVNDEGGIDGHPIELVVKDSAATPATALTVVKDLVEKEQVSAIILADAVAETPVSDYLKGQKIAVLETQGYDPTLWGVVPNFMTTTVTDKYMLSGYGVAAAASGASSYGMAACAEIASCAQAGEANAGLAPALGLEYTGTVKISASQPSFTAECLNFLDSDTEAVAVALDLESTGVRVIGDCLQQGYDGSFIVGSGSVIGSLFDTLPEAKFAGTMNAFPWWVDDEPVQQYRDVVEEYGDGTDPGSTWATSTWTALEMFRKAVAGKATDGLTAQQVLDAYGTVKDETLGGLLASPVTFAPGKPATEIPCYWIYEYVGGSDTFENIQEGSAGNGVDTDLATSCYEGPDF